MTATRARRVAAADRLPIIDMHLHAYTLRFLRLTPDEMRRRGRN